MDNFASTGGCHIGNAWHKYRTRLTQRTFQAWLSTYTQAWTETACNCTQIAGENSHVDTFSTGIDLTTSFDASTLKQSVKKFATKAEVTVEFAKAAAPAATADASGKSRLGKHRFSDSCHKHSRQFRR